MDSVALYYPSLEHSGGIERVVVELCRIFSEKNYPCVLLSDIEPLFYKNRIHVECVQLPQAIEERKQRWKDCIHRNNIKFVICNGGFGASDLQDIDFIHEAGAKVINTVHFSFPSPMLFNEAWQSYENAQRMGQKCDAVATVNKLDAVWWRALRCNAYPVRNPFTYYDHSEKTRDYNSHTIVWVGRGAPPKKPVEALQIIAEVAKQVPDAKLLMVGIENGQKSYGKYVKQLGIEKNVEFIAPTNEIGQYYEQASLHMLTSITESFCLVVAEAKSYHLPTIMYDVPFIELVEDGKGVIIHEQSDIKGMAASIVELFNDPERLQLMGKEAFSTLADFTDDEVIVRWQAIFDSLEKGECYKPNPKDPHDIIVREIYSAWMNHCRQNVWKIDFFDNLERATGRSMKGVIDGGMGGIFVALKKLKRILKH